jgi:hypothetical protein
VSVSGSKGEAGAVAAFFEGGEVVIDTLLTETKIIGRTQEFDIMLDPDQRCPMKTIRNNNKK